MHTFVISRAFLLKDQLVAFLPKGLHHLALCAASLLFFPFFQFSRLFDLGNNCKILQIKM